MTTTTAAPSRRARGLRRLAATAAATALACAGAATPAGAAVATETSSNWAGYAIASTASNRTTFRRVSGTWTVAAGDCATSGAGSAATWVGLGGFAGGATALEQTGTELDCSASGRASYSAWYEFVPAAAVGVRMTVRPGDRMSASVSVSGKRVVVRLRDLTTGAAFSKTTRMSAPDVTSAEWIVEAPSECDDRGTCSTLPLGDFGTVGFTHASATTTRGRTGTVASTAWRTTRLTLSTSGGRTGPSRFAGATTAAGARASALRSAGSAFSVAFVPGAALPASPEVVAARDGGL
jgi:hypothetical protein